MPDVGASTVMDPRQQQPPAAPPPGLWGFLADIANSYMQGGKSFIQDPMRSMDIIGNPPTSAPGMIPAAPPRPPLPGQITQPSSFLLDPVELFSNLATPGAGMGAGLVAGGIKKGLFKDALEAITKGMGKGAGKKLTEGVTDPSRRAFLGMMGKGAMAAAAAPKGTIEAATKAASSGLPKLNSVAEDIYELGSAIDVINGSSLTGERGSVGALEAAEAIAELGYKLKGLAVSPGAFIARVEGKGGKIADVVLADSDLRWDRSLKRILSPIVESTGTSMKPEGAINPASPESVFGMLADSMHDSFVERGIDPKLLKVIAKEAASEEKLSIPTADVVNAAIKMRESGWKGSIPVNTYYMEESDKQFLHPDQAKAILSGELDPGKVAKTISENYTNIISKREADRAAKREAAIKQAEEFEKGVNEGYNQSLKTAKDKGPGSDYEKTYGHTEEQRALGRPLGEEKAVPKSPPFTTSGTLHPLIMRNPRSFSAYTEDPSGFMTNYWQDFLTTLERVSPGITKEIIEKGKIK